MKDMECLAVKTEAMMDIAINDIQERTDPAINSSPSKFGETIDSRSETVQMPAALNGHGDQQNVYTLREREYRSDVSLTQLPALKPRGRNRSNSSNNRVYSSGSSNSSYSSV
jgi:hypothetical protein